MFLITPQLNEDLLDLADDLMEPWCIKALKPSLYHDRDCDCSLAKITSSVINPQAQARRRAVKRLRKPGNFKHWVSKRSRRDVSEEVDLKRESQVQNTEKEFRIQLDLSQYRPEEVKITTDSHKITVKARHEDKDDMSFVSYEMIRSYDLPEDVDVRTVSSTMNSDGLLSIKMCKGSQEVPEEIPIAVEFKDAE